MTMGYGVGTGTASVVQIHDPSCAMCRSLQKQARAALRDCDDAEARQYLVANIASAEGAAFAGRMGLPHVTLALFDADGRHVHTISGVTPSAEIKADISRYLG